MSHADFDVFLCYHSPDKNRVEAIGRLLRERGVTPWLDIWEIRPGLPWQHLVELKIQDIGSAAVFVGSAGFGPWQGMEIGALLRQFVERRCPVIPVILPECQEVPELPVFLQGMAWVDFRESTPDPLEQLMWGITGQRPTVEAETPEPDYANEEVRSLSEALECAFTRKEECLSAGRDPEAIDREILDLRRRLREGGQLRAGDILYEGRYRLIEPLGKGGFATVWKAYNREERNLAAIKVLHGQYAQDRTQRERFFRGARKMAELHHQRIVSVIEKRLKDGGYHFFVMEYLEGGDLRQAVLKGRLGGDAVLPIIVAVGQALEFAHGHRVIHRDIKPANILLDDKGKPKLTDFDLVHAFDTTGGTRTEGGMVGTFLYVAPEAMKDYRKADVRADVFSLAMTATFILYKKTLPMESFRDMPSFVAGLSCSANVKKVLTRATSWDAEARYPSVAEFMTAFDRAFSYTPSRKAVLSSFRQTAAQARAMISKGRAEEGLRLLEQFNEEHPGSVEGYLEAGELCMKTGRVQDAVWFLEHACDLEPGDSQIYRRLGNALLESDEPQKALDALRQAETLGERSRQLYESLSKAYARLSRITEPNAEVFLEETCRRYEEILRSNPGDCESLNQWGVTLTRLADLAHGRRRELLLEESCLRYAEAIRHCPEMYRAHYNWGNALGNLADHVTSDERFKLRQQACACYEKALEHNPEYAKAFDNWSGVLLKMGSETSKARRTSFWLEAVEKAKQASELSEHSGDFNLSCALSQLQRFDEAAPVLANAVLQSPEIAVHALDDPDLFPLFNARPRLHEALRESLPLSQFQDLSSIERWLSSGSRKY